MKKIMIQGHLIRGNEVIKALEELGGINYCNFSGNFTEFYYYLDNKNCICKTPDNYSMHKTYNKIYIH